MSPEPTFSILIPTHNRPALLAEATGSVRQQRFADFECIIVDDGSSIPAQVPSDDRFRIVRRDDAGGPAAAVNAGLREARGRFVLRLDDDDLLAPDRLDIALEGLQRAPIALCWARYLDAAPTAQRNYEGLVGDTILDHVTPHMGAAAVRRNLFAPLDESYAASEDVEWWLRMAQQVPVTTVSRFGYFIRRHDEVRGRHGVQARADGSRRMLHEHEDYFEAHPKAAALRWKRIGLNEMELANRPAARAAFGRSLRARPSLRTVKHLLRASVPGRPGPA